MLWPAATPAVVAAMRPTDIAAVLGLDQHDGVEAMSPELAPAPRPKPRAPGEPKRERHLATIETRG